MNGRPPVPLLPCRRGLHSAAVREPELRRLPGHAKSAVRTRGAVPLVRDKVEVGIRGAAMDVHKLGSPSLRLEVRGRSRAGEHVVHLLSPDDPTLAVVMAENGGTVHTPPNLPADLRHFVVANGIAGEARRLRGPRPDHDRPITYEIANLSSDRGRHI